MKAVVLGAGGFIGGHLVARLEADGVETVGVDVKPLMNWYQVGTQNVSAFDVAEKYNTNELRRIMSEADEVYCLAADMGGMGFIENNKLRCMLTVKTSVAALEAALYENAGRFFYSSSACVYPGYAQGTTSGVSLAEADAYPADAEDGYGWEKLFTERLCRHFTEDADLITRVARYHNVAGELGTWDGGREKAPAAICRKVAEAVISGVHKIGIWGDGEQTRSFMHVSDCVEGSVKLMRSNIASPLNIGSDQLISINDLVSMVERVANVELEREYDLTAPQGVRGRNSDNTLCEERLLWSPLRRLEDWVPDLYQWVYQQVWEKWNR